MYIITLSENGWLALCKMFVFWTSNVDVKVDDRWFIVIELCGRTVTVFVIDRCPPGRVRGSIDPFPSIAGFQGVPCSPLPQHLQRRVGPAQIKLDPEGTWHFMSLSSSRVEGGKPQTVHVMISTIHTMTCTDISYNLSSKIQSQLIL